MKIVHTLPLIAAAALGLAACSQKTENNAERTVTSAGNDIEANYDAAVREGSEAARDAGATLDNAADATGNAVVATGDAIGNVAADTGASIDREVDRPR